MLVTDIKAHWENLRRLTYDVLSVINDDHLRLKLPYQQSDDLGFQFYQALGTQESFIPFIADGVWHGWHCTLADWDKATVEQFKVQMQRADQLLFSTLDVVDLLKPFADGKSPLTHYLTLTGHESYRQGNIINFLYALNVQIPASWSVAWRSSQFTPGSSQESASDLTPVPKLAPVSQAEK